MVGRGSGGDEEEIRARLYAPLNSRRPEIEEAIATRIRAVSGATGSPVGEAHNGMSRAVSVGVDYALCAVEDGTAQIPAVLLAQTRQAARNGIALDVVFRRCFAAYALFCDFIMRVAEEGPPLPSSLLRRVLQAQAFVFERFLDAIAAEYTRESRNRRLPAERRRIESVKKLLAGEPVDTTRLAYELDDWHVGAIARGDRAVSALRDLADLADRRLLSVRPQGERTWAWLGGRRRIEMVELVRGIALEPGDDALIALGEPARGIAGWQLTHQQASAAFGVAPAGSGGVVRYADVSLLASISQDRLLTRSLRQLYLIPLAVGRDGGAALRETLRAYFSADRNVSSAAAALGVSRQTVGNRLRAVEEKLGRTVESCAPEIEMALRLEGIDDAFRTATAPPSALPTSED